MFFTIEILRVETNIFYGKSIPSYILYKAHTQSILITRSSNRPTSEYFQWAQTFIDVQTDTTQISLI